LPRGHVQPINWFVIIGRVRDLAVGDVFGCNVLVANELPGRYLQPEYGVDIERGLHFDGARLLRAR
jgi:hypothetical protein